MDPSPETRLLGQTIAGRYRLNTIQASGAFGTVFHAHQVFCNQFMRQVAVKVSRQVGLTEETAPHLFGDAIILARLLSEGDRDHEGRTHLVQIFDMGLLPDHDDRAYLAMEYVDGLPLLSHMRAAGRFSVATGLRFVKQICRALALVHSQGAVHRDLKADNILVDRRGVVRVVDFGLAAFADERSGFVHGAMGTFTYMAPETVHGRSTPASDVYSLGLLMYELFTGGGPHLNAPWRNDTGEPAASAAGGSDENYRIKKSFRFAPPSEVQNEIRNDYRWLDGLILRCLEIDPARRFADASDLLAAVEACERGEELPPVPPSDGEEEPPPVARNPKAEDAEKDQLLREVRRLLAARAYGQAIDRLDVHRPAEWATLDNFRRPNVARPGPGLSQAGATRRRRVIVWNSCGPARENRRCCRKRTTPAPCPTWSSATGRWDRPKRPRPAWTRRERCCESSLAASAGRSARGTLAAKRTHCLCITAPKLRGSHAGRPKRPPFATRTRSRLGAGAGAQGADCVPPRHAAQLSLIAGRADGHVPEGRRRGGTSVRAGLAVLARRCLCGRRAVVYERCRTRQGNDCGGSARRGGLLAGARADSPRPARRRRRFRDLAPATGRLASGDRVVYRSALALWSHRTGRAGLAGCARQQARGRLPRRTAAGSAFVVAPRRFRWRNQGACRTPTHERGCVGRTPPAPDLGGSRSGKA